MNTNNKEISSFRNTGTSCSKIRLSCFQREVSALFHHTGEKYCTQNFTSYKCPKNCRKKHLPETNMTPSQQMKFRHSKPSASNQIKTGSHLFLQQSKNTHWMCTADYYHKSKRERCRRKDLRPNQPSQVRSAAFKNLLNYEKLVHFSRFLIA